jgi:hypothetical protein
MSTFSNELQNDPDRSSFVLTSPPILIVDRVHQRVRLLGRSRSVIAGVLQATSLTFAVAATQIGLQLGAVSRASAAGLVAAGLVSVVIYRH